ncbi:MAG TPA: hypothetical protein PLT95_04400 [Agitococcus sp.]|nr:hypothetical protein [Agitococcus sp.]
MAKLLFTILRILTEKLRWLVLIVIVLLAAFWLKHEWQQLEQAEQQYLQQRQTQIVLNKRYQELQIAQQKTAQATAKLETQLANRQTLVTRLEQELSELRQQRDDLWEEHWLSRKNPLSETAQQLREYKIKIAALTAQLALAKQAQQLWQDKVSNSAIIAENKRLIEELLQTKQALNHISNTVEHSQHLVNSSLLTQLKQAISEILPMAIGILLAAILTPIIIKIVLYFLIAPIVSRLKAVQIDASIQEPYLPIATGHISQHALTVELLPHQELLLHPDYLQSFSQRAEKTTQWFLNASIPLTSWAAGLVTLVRIRSAETEVVQLASMYHPFEELVIISLPPNSRLVCKPRGLVGVIKDRNHPVVISKHWRLFSLHSWLTLQLRYLIFHGECQLIIKGSGGVVVESAQQSRLIQQSATLGFSSDLAYSNYRCETFVSYYLGKDSLFNDRFQGKTGLYFYEQSPLHQPTQGKASKRVEGIWDALLKVFGI